MTVTAKIVAITGASSGIGEATAKRLAQAGAKVLVGARRADRLEALVRDIRNHGGEAELRAVDVVDPAGVKEFINFAVERFGRLDVLVNNAGVMPLSPMRALKVDEWNKMVDVNIKGVLNGVAAALPVFERQGSGHFVNVASVAGHVVFPGGAVYCATKFAVRAISEGLRQELKTIRVTIISPGAVATELGHDITNAEMRDFVSGVREFALNSDDIASAVHYAVTQPDNVDVNEIVVRPVQQAL
ncbi:SDR family oxidoreductase [Amphiplicatus metriothermophilus]|uniref:NADP-dependent 3-hydroxy acid dehydrogenase YdfG n=1 Tax=Amphiplicatus metriothermophilus TaxID=1519374 RepID=A0A239PL58_9PROT|nr:SDR family oxidoreductase [Amphiplicatus metriothermophilus]MBB5517597.1 NADP-dependent 3-hydroxy acid dehydrogenase YdfG [Amphiplicatus metriothermophilus]SNT68069.1 NADP-dependent 3-hydroxy acid dehydrogenase YdfG [Amphiplicatus metriothermophilus]